MGYSTASQFDVPPGRYYSCFCLPVTDMTKIADGDLVTNFTPGFPGKIVKFFWIQGTAVTTGGKASTLNLEVNTTNVESVPGTTATIALTSATCTPIGKVINGSAIGLHNSFDSDDTISVEAASTTAFSEGSGVIIIIVEGKVL